MGSHHITLEQVKAARALLGWNQQDLATAASLSKPALANFERGTVNPRVETLNSLQKALEAAGIEFTEGPGVRLQRNTLVVQIFEGPDSLSRLWGDILNTLSAGDERLVYGVNDAQFIDCVGRLRFDKAMKKFHKAGIGARVLSSAEDTIHLDPYSEYRILNNTHTENVAYFVYKNKYAILLWEPLPRVVLIENQLISDNYRRQFEGQWKMASVPEQPK